MKISVLLLIMTVFQLSATETYSQMAKLTLNLEDVKISEALQQIEEQSEFYFLYSPKLINVEKRVNIIADQEPILDILNEIFRDEVHFAVYDRQILITPKETKISESLQQKKITGIVTEASSGNPLPGVNVVVQGTTIGTMTDIDGKYAIDVPNEKAVLEFSFISYNNQAISVGNQTTINVSLRLDETTLDEIVVIGYGTQKKSLITGAISSIDIEQISTVSSTSAEQT
ncbi:MAG: carboxypeptidase-like regulatory domain-containing protein, partial [Bacteroidales bacterium]